MKSKTSLRKPVMAGYADEKADPWSEMLHGWKAIASFLGRSERTARRWHARYALPIIILPSGNVFALARALKTYLLTFDEIVRRKGCAERERRREHAAYMRSRKRKSKKLDGTARIGDTISKEVGSDSDDSKTGLSQ